MLRSLRDSICLPHSDLRALWCSLDGGVHSAPRVLGGKVARCILGGAAFSWRPGARQPCRQLAPRPLTAPRPRPQAHGCGQKALVGEAILLPRGGERAAAGACQRAQLGVGLPPRHLCSAGTVDPHEPPGRPGAPARHVSRDTHLSRPKVLPEQSRGRGNSGLSHFCFSTPTLRVIL